MSSTTSVFRISPILLICAAALAFGQKPKYVMSQEPAIIGKDQNHVRVSVPNGVTWCRVQFPDGGVIRDNSPTCTGLHQAIEGP